ncbi:hypothetical protein AVEN_45911-1 [Araneus ventricosus]|uniref:Uncharacterized protein n=1 Tax=Araneus ventricosus TaxID=182803 RepID=A0A4Y2E920_ARAVE|nr:hypothetical protein AVEN_45911-1 [Araneus ventricosus]
MHITIKRSQVNYRFVKEISWQLEEILTRLVNQQKLNHDTEDLRLSQKIPPSETYRISQLEPSNEHLYATTAHVSQLKAWRSWNKDDDD